MNTGIDTVHALDKVLGFVQHKLTTMEWFLVRSELLELIYNERQDALASFTVRIKESGLWGKQ